MTSWLRLFAPLYLTVHASLALAELANPWFLVLGTLAACFIGRSLRLWKTFPTVVVLVAVYLGFRFFLFLIGIFWPQTLGLWDFWPQDWNRQADLVAAPFLLFGITSYLVEANRRLLVWERLFNAVLLALLFWSQGGYKVSFYPHPAVAALSLGVWLVFESSVLFFYHRPPRPKEKSQSSGSRWFLGAGALAILFAGAGFLWTLLGHYEEASTSSGGGLLKPQAFQFDFAPLVRLESRISLGDQLILLYREDGQPQTRYLRRFVLSGYDPKRGFFVDSNRPDEKPRTVGRSAETFPESNLGGGRVAVRQEYYLVNLDPSSFLGLNEPLSVQPFDRWDRSSFVSAYRVTSKVPTDSLWQIDTIPDFGLNAEELKHYTDFGGQTWIRDLARGVTGDSETPFEKTAAIENFLKSHYWYSLQPGTAVDGDQLKHFLLKAKKGYCSYFAFAMTLMLRSVGVPARVAVGFFTNPDEGMLGFFPVRALQAHAWVEVPFAGFGWIPFDPTTDRLAPGENFTNPPKLPPNQLADLIAEILKADPKPSSMRPVAPAPVPSFWEGLWEGAVDQWKAWWSLDILTLYLCFVFLSPVFRNVFWRLQPPRRRSESLFRRARSEFHSAGIRFRPSATPMDLLIAVQGFPRTSGAAESFGPLVAEVLASRYAPEYSAERSQEALRTFQRGAEARREALGWFRWLMRKIFPFFSEMNFGGRM